MITYLYLKIIIKKYIDRIKIGMLLFKNKYQEPKFLPRDTGVPKKTNLYFGGIP